MKQALAGLTAGVLLGGLVLWLVAGDRHAGAPDRLAAVPGDGQGGTSADPLGDQDAVLLQEATARLERLRAEVAVLRDSHAAAGTPGRTTDAGRSELARLLASNLADYSDNPDLKLPVNEDMFFRLQAYIRRLSEESGLSLEEVAASPEGFAALAREVLDALEPELDPEMRAEVGKAMEAARREWEAYAKDRAGMTRLERGGKAEHLFEELVEHLREILDGRADDAIDSLETLWWDAQPTWTGGRHVHMVSSPEEAASKWTESWSKDLRLTPVQKNALKPIVDDYVRALGELKLDSGRNQRNGAFDLMVRAQHRMLDTLGLTPEQMQELQAQVNVYDYQVRPSK